jgi:hypothetical protein
VPSRGLGLRAQSLFVASNRVAGSPHPSSVAADPNPTFPVPTILQDYFFAGTPTATQIPYAWLSGAEGARFRAETMVNVATISQLDGASTTATNVASRTAYGVRAVSGQLDTACDADPANLATWLTTYRGDPRMKQPTLALIELGSRTANECVSILRVREGMRITITGAPATWPQGAYSLVVEGVAHASRDGVRLVVWATSAVPGTTPGTPGPWFRWGSSSYGGTDVIPF